MARILITGMSGVGKSTLLDGLARRGHAVLDTDYDGWVQGDGLWDAERMRQLLDRAIDIVIAGTVENQGAFSDRFDHIVLLSAPLEVLLDRVGSRTTNSYGKRPEERDEIAQNIETVEPRLRRSCSLELDGREAPERLVDAVEDLMLAAR